MGKKLFYLGANGKGVQLEGFELEMLAFLTQQKVLTIKQLYKYSCHFNDISYNSFRNKIWRWNKYSVVEMKTITLQRRWGNEVSIVSIGQNGLRILIMESYIPDSWINLDLRSNFSLSNFDHYFCTQQVVLDTVLRLKTKGLEVESIRPSKLSTTVNYNDRLIVPDWILKYGNKLLLIESDMGTETINTLEDKVKRYVELAKFNNELEFNVLFVLIDDSIDTVKGYKNNGPRRLANMKRAFLNSNIIHETNFSLFVSYLNRAPKVAEKALIDSETHRVSTQLTITHKILEELNSNFEYNFSQIHSDNLYLHETKNFLHADKSFNLSNLANTISINILYIFISEGNIKQLNRLHYHNYLVKKGLYKQQIDKVIAIYQNIEERENDNLVESMANVLVVDNETLIKNIHVNPTFFKVTGPNKLIAVSFEDD